MRLCIFCSANEQTDADYHTLTDELGRWAAKNGHSIVFGGNDSGLMHTVSKAAKEEGARVIGVVPRKIEEMGKLSPYLDIHIPTDNLTDRKDIMEAQADVFIALPGGIGTLDEVFTIAGAANLGYHHKPVILYNMKGYWDSLVAMLDDIAARGNMRSSWRSHIHVAGNLDEIALFLSQQEAR